MELNEYQRLAKQTDQQPETGLEVSHPHNMLIPLLGLAGEAGELLSEHKKWLRDGDSYKLFSTRVREELGDLLWYLSNVATKHDLTLEDIATHNLSKIRNRWQSPDNEQATRSLFDDRFPPKERLPRLMDVSIYEEDGERAVIVINGIKTGDSLSDNRFEDDGYRYHDIFHLAYASVLGWSPTLRSLMKRKRKSDPRVDEIEDGGRAIVIEEGIAAMVFSYAERRSFLDGVEGVNYELLRTIKDMTAHLEVRSRSEGEWERAILLGFELWRNVRTRGEGLLQANLDEGSIALVG